MYDDMKPDPVNEKTTWRFPGHLYDESGQSVPGSALTSLTLDIYALDDARTSIAASVNILNADRGTIGEDGALAIIFTPSDSALIDATVAEEIHVACIRWTYGIGGAKSGSYEYAWRVRNLAKVA